MEELIKETEKLYKQIDKAQVYLINARLQKDEEGKKSAISEMETAMCNAMQLLKCFIDRKDNIIDLSELFHNAAETPDMRGDLLYESPFGGYGVLNTLPLCDEKWSYFKRVYKIRRWAYLDDLLPKGGE